MDLETYIGRYSGTTRLQRLLLIAKTTPDEALSQQAFDLAEQQMKQDGNVRKYTDIFGGGQAGEAAGEATAAGSASGERPEEQRPSTDATQPEVIPMPTVTSSAAGHQNFGRFRRKTPPNPKPVDVDWITNTESNNQMARQMLAGRLSTAQSHLHKEAIRTAYMALAEHDLKTGFENEAMSAYMRATDYCTSRAQTAQLSLLSLQVAFCIGNFQYVREYSKRLELTLGTGKGSSSTILDDVEIKLNIAKGIERMVAGKYDDAAKILIPLVMKGSTNGEKNPEGAAGGGGDHLLDWPGVTSPEDLALYASLMCLVTATHASNSRRQMMALADHPEALELVPGMKDLILQWTRANYEQCMAAFGESDQSEDHVQVLPMGVDPYLTPSRFTKLSQQVREICLVEYLKPFQSVKLDSMQQLFPSIGPNLVDVLVDLMSRKLLPPTFRLDCRAGVLFQIPENQNPSRQMQAMEERIMDDTHALLVRLACLEYDLIVQDPSAGPATRGGRSRSLRARDGGGASFIPVADDGGDSSEEDRSDDDEDDNMMVGGEEPDEQMMDAEAIMAMNPEDMY